MRLSELAIETRQYSEIENYGRQAVQIAETIPDRQTVSSAYNNIALRFYHEGRLVESGEAAQRALTVAEKSGYLCGKGKVLTTLGLLAEEQSQFADALNLFEQSLGFAQRTRSEADIAIVLHHIARMEDKLSRHGEALDHAQRSFMLLTKLHDPSVLMNRIRVWNYRAVHLSSGEWDVAQTVTIRSGCELCTSQVNR